MKWYLLQFPRLPIPIPGMKTHTMFYAEVDVLLFVQFALKSGLITLPGGIPLTGTVLYEYTDSGWSPLLKL